MLNMNRRQALVAGLATSSAALLRIPFATADSLPSPLLIAITEVDPTTDKIIGLYRTVLSRDLPVTVSFDDSLGSRSYGTSLLETLRRDVEDNPDRLEIALHADTLEPGDAYSQLRDVSERQSGLTRGLNGSWKFVDQPALMAYTATTRTAPAYDEDFSALRAAGIRTVIPLAPSETTSSGGYYQAATGLVNLAGASVIYASSSGQMLSPERVALQLRQATKAPGPLILALPFPDLVRLNHSDARAYVEELSNRLHTQAQGGAFRAVLPQVLYEQSVSQARRYVLMRIDDYRLDLTADEEHRAFVDALLGVGVPLTEAVIPRGYGPSYFRPLGEDAEASARLRTLSRNEQYDLAIHGFTHKRAEFDVISGPDAIDALRKGLRETSQAYGRVPRSFIPPYNVVNDAARSALSECGFNMLSAAPKDFSAITGLDRFGLLNAANTIFFEREWTGNTPYFTKDQLLKQFGSRNDAVFMIHPGTVTTPEKKEALLSTLADLAVEPGTRLVNFDQYRSAVLPKIPKLDLVQGARARRSARPVDVTRISEGDHAELERDAVTAWRFFERLLREDGVLPGIAQETPAGLSTYPHLTMWDVGSLLLAELSALELGLIGEAAFEDNIVKLIAFLRRSPFVYQGRKLPNVVRALDGGDRPRQGFDVIDVGRLLIALHLVDRHTSQTLAIRSLVESWTLRAALRDNRLHDITNGRFVSKHENYYAPYAARGFRLWDIDVAPTHGELASGGGLDKAISVITEVSRNGPIATEPVTTDEIELGASDFSNQMMDVVHEAQLRRFEETGILTCASEVATDVEPWFTYQGLQLRDRDMAWTVHASYPDPRFETPAFADDLRAISTKGCYLWMAARPGPYSDRLVGHARRHARTDNLGFASGTYVSSGARINVSDVNTNALILETIAYVLRARQPIGGSGKFDRSTEAARAAAARQG